MLWEAVRKIAASVGSATPDPTKDSAAASPIPPPRPANKPPPGRRGPIGMQPRQTFSRINTGASPISDAGGSSQKGTTPDAMNMLPQKVASEAMGQMTSRMSIQEMIKAAAAGTAEQVAVTDEAIRQMSGEEPIQKHAQPEDPGVPGESVSTAYAEKLAAAIEYIVEADKTATVPEGGSATKQGPGDGPNALDVSQAEASDKPIEPGGQGQATSAHIPPKDPATQPEKVQTGKANTGLADNTEMKHPEQPTEPISNEKAPIKAASAPVELIRELIKKGQLENLKGKKAPAYAGKAAPGEPPAAMGKKGSVDPRLVDALLATTKAAGEKVAEDAINPAQISTAGTIKVDEPPPGASASEEGPAPAEPSDVNSQKAMVGSNQSAIDYNKRQAKADPKKDVNKVLTEPALSAAHDSTLNKALSKGTETAKISSAEAVKTAAARALLSKLAAEADDKAEKKKKEKESQFNAPTVGGAAGGPMTQ